MRKVKVKKRGKGERIEPYAFSEISSGIKNRFRLL